VYENTDIQNYPGYIYIIYTNMRTGPNGVCMHTNVHNVFVQNEQTTHTHIHTDMLHTYRHIDIDTDKDTERQTDT